MTRSDAEVRKALGMTASEWYGLSWDARLELKQDDLGRPAVTAGRESGIAPSGQLDETVGSSQAAPGAVGERIPDSRDRRPAVSPRREKWSGVAVAPVAVHPSEPAIAAPHVDQPAPVLRRQQAISGPVPDEWYYARPEKDRAKVYAPFRPGRRDWRGVQLYENHAPVEPFAFAITR